MERERKRDEEDRKSKEKKNKKTKKIDLLNDYFVFLTLKLTKLN